MQQSLKSQSTCFLAVALVVLSAGVTGCGTNLAEVLTQTANATGRTFLDLLLTEFANTVADALDEENTPPADDGDGDDGDDIDDGDDGDDGGPLDGSILYADNCAACHGADGASGFGPDITGMTADEVAAGLESGTHGAITLTDDEITAIAEFLGGGGGPVDGSALFADNCAACHGADGASGFAPDITGLSADEMAAGLESGTHGAITLTDDEVAAIAEFLGGGGGSASPDPVAGESFYIDAVCAACHCADATGGCALDAPSLIGASVDTLEAVLVGDAEHPGGKQDASADDLANLEAYLASP